MSIEKALKANAPAILTGIGIVANFGAVYFTYKSSKKIAAVLADKSMTRGQKFLGVVKAGALPLALSVISAGCSMGSYTIQNQRLKQSQAQLATMTATAAIATRELKEWREKTVDIVGEEKAREIQQGIVNDKVKATKSINTEPVTEVSHVATSLSGGNTLWYDERHDRWFRTALSNVQNAVSGMNDDLKAYDFVSHQELYSRIGIHAPDSDEHVGYTSYSNPRGVELDEYLTCVYPETGETARILKLKEPLELDPDFETFYHCL